MTMDIMNISNEEIGEIVKNDPNMMMYLGLSTKVKDLTNELEKVKADQQIHKSKLDTHENNINELNNKTTNHDEKFYAYDSKFNIFQFDTTGKYEDFKDKAKARVYKLVGEEGTVKNILFYQPFLSKIKSDVARFLGVSKIGLIKMDDSDKAIAMVDAWKPDRKYLNKKINEYQRLQFLFEKEPKKVKDSDKSRIGVIDKYLEMTNGGNNIEF